MYSVEPVLESPNIARVRGGGGRVGYELGRRTGQQEDAPESCRVTVKVGEAHTLVRMNSSKAHAEPNLRAAPVGSFLVQTIKERKGALAPQIKELRTVRQRFQDVEGEHTEKKKGYDAAALQYSASHAKLDSEVKELAAAVLGDESQFHLTHARAQVTQPLSLTRTVESE